MNADLDKIADYVGKLCGAAKHDLETASPADVGMNGMPVYGYRQAYFEGCKDMANGVAAQIPDEWSARFQERARAAFDTAFKEAAAGLPSPPVTDKALDAAVDDMIERYPVTLNTLASPPVTGKE